MKLPSAVKGNLRGLEQHVFADVSVYMPTYKYESTYLSTYLSIDLSIHLCLHMGVSYV